MKSFRTLLLATLAATLSVAAQAQTITDINPSAVRDAQIAGPVRIAVTDGFNVSAGAPTAALDLVDVRSSDAFVVEGPARLAIEGIAFFVVDCAVYSGERVVARFNRAAPVFDGPFQGRFRFGLARTAEGAATSYGCWATAYGARGGANWRAYEEPNANVPGGYVQMIKMEDGQFWNGAAITEQVVLHFSGAMSGAPGRPTLSGLVAGPRIPDGSDVQWRPPIIPPGYSAQIAAARAGQGANDWNSASDYLRSGDADASDYIRGGNTADSVAIPTATLPVAEPVQAPRP